MNQDLPPLPPQCNNYQHNSSGVNRQCHGSGRGHGGVPPPPTNPASSYVQQNNDQRVGFYFNETFGDGECCATIPAGVQMDNSGTIDC